MILEAIPVISYYIFCAMIFTLAFAYQSYTYFGSNIYEFRSFNQSIINGVRYWVTELDYDDFKNNARRLGPWFFIFWTIIFLLFLGNVFVAIIMDAYESE